MMKRVAAVWMAWMLLLSALILPVSAAYPLSESVKTHSSSAVVVFLGTDMDRDMLMYEQNADDRLAPAGMVRVMVGLYALKVLEDQQMDPAAATGTYTEEIYAHITGTGLYTVGMNYGDVWRVEDLLNISVIQTAADAVATLVTALCGSPERFLEGMNAMAAQIGCTNTHFSNVLGLDDPEQYTSARDMYKILRYATLNYPEMITMLSRSEYTAHPVTGQVDSWPTTNEMLRVNSEFYYSPLVYGRSGFTESIGQSCASVARDDGVEFMTVVMGCQDEEGNEGLAFRDTMSLFRWVYNAFSYQTIVSKGQPLSRIDVKLARKTDTVAVAAAESLEGMLRNDIDLSTLRYEITFAEDALVAPVEKGRICGTAKVYDGEKLIGEIDLCASDNVRRSYVLAALDAVWSVLSSSVMLMVYAVLCALVIGYIVLTLVHNRHRKQTNKRVKRYK